MGCEPNYFGLGVKTNRRDVYNRERELAILEKHEHPIIALTGIRRLGKSTLLSVALRGKNAILVDFRGVGPNPSPRLLFSRFEDAVNTSGLRRLWSHLSSTISSISLAGFGVSFKRSEPLTLTFSTVFDAIQKYAESEGSEFVVAIDEVQEARGFRPLVEAIAHSYDYNDKVKFVLAGSQVGLLQDFLGTGNPESPLYGRYVYELVLRRFSAEESLDFLVKGFEACGVPPKGVEEAVRALDGVVGWLVYYGYMCVHEGADLKRVVESAVALELGELSKLRGKYYPAILKAVALGANTWSNIYRYVKANVDVVSEAAFNEALERLVKYSLLQKRDSEYEIPDPITREAAKRM